MLTVISHFSRRVVAGTIIRSLVGRDHWQLKLTMVNEHRACKMNLGPTCRRASRWIVCQGVSLKRLNTEGVGGRLRGEA